MQDRLHTTYNRPQTERPTLHLIEQQQGSRLGQARASGVVQGLPGLTMDLEQGGCYPPLMSQMAVAPDRWDNSAHTINLQSECQQVEMELQSKLYDLIEDEVESSNNTGLPVLPEQGNVQMSAEGEREKGKEGQEEISTKCSVGIMTDDSSTASKIQEDSSIAIVVKNQKTLTGEAHFGSEAAASSDKACIIVPCVASCGIMVGTPLTEHSSAFTQTEKPLTADKSVLTELSMSDLDYATQEFSKLKVAQKVSKKKERSLNQQEGKQCDCAGLAELAKLSVLALQYYMFQQHCSSGQLEKTRQEDRTLLECSQDAQGNPRMDCNKSRNTSILVPWKRSVTFKANTAEENQSSAGKELNTGEVWYDAKEDLHPGSIPAEMKAQSEEMSAELAKEEEMDSGIVFPDIANNVTKKRLGVRNTPMPRATIVPQHYGTMVAFDTLMAELMHFHPGMAKQCIVGALKELWDVYQSDLFTLPLSTVRQMTTDVLNRATNVTPP
ncbi:RNA-binding protein 44 isoform X2 [Festucalex cinctus]